MTEAAAATSVCALAPGDKAQFVCAVDGIPAGTVGLVVDFGSYLSCLVRINEPFRGLFEVPTAALEAEMVSTPAIT